MNNKDHYKQRQKDYLFSALWKLVLNSWLWSFGCRWSVLAWEIVCVAQFTIAMSFGDLARGEKIG